MIKSNSSFIPPVKNKSCTEAFGNFSILSHSIKISLASEIVKFPSLKPCFNALQTASFKSILYAISKKSNHFISDICVTFFRQRWLLTFFPKNNPSICCQRITGNICPLMTCSMSCLCSSCL